MRKGMMKAAALAAMLGCVFQFGGCVNAFFQFLGIAIVDQIGQFFLDNDAVLDIFPDAPGLGAPM